MTSRQIMRSSGVTLIACLIALTSTSSAASSGRKATREYTMPNGIVATGLSATWTVIDWKTFKARPDERTVEFSIVDATGLDVWGHVHTDTDGDGDKEDAGDFCGKSDPIRVQPGHRIEVAILSGECPGGTASLPTEGTITATFSK